MVAPIVETHALGKSFGLTPVLNDTEFRLAAGRAAIIIGGNGSGKSTLLAILAGLIPPSAGSALVFGEDTCRLTPHNRRRIGMLSHQSFLYPNLTARENLEFYAEIYGVPDTRDAADSWLTRVGLADHADERARSLSRGMEQRLALARAMIHEPDLMLFDEPFAALDSDGRARVSSLIKSALTEGRSLIVTAHQPLEIDDVDLELHEIIRGQVVAYRDREQGRSAPRLRSLPGPKAR